MPGAIESYDGVEKSGTCPRKTRWVAPGYCGEGVNHSSNERLTQIEPVRAYGVTDEKHENNACDHVAHTIRNERPALNEYAIENYLCAL